MNTFAKKLVSLVLALTMVLSLGVTVFAEMDEPVVEPVAVEEELEEVVSEVPAEEAEEVIDEAEEPVEEVEAPAEEVEEPAEEIEEVIEEPEEVIDEEEELVEDEVESYEAVALDETELPVVSYQSGSVSVSKDALFTALREALGFNTLIGSYVRLTGGELDKATLGRLEGNITLEDGVSYLVELEDTLIDTIPLNTWKPIATLKFSVIPTGKVVLKSGVSITYNKDAAVMENALFDNLIDWDASELPEKAALSIADFSFEYHTSPIGNALSDLDKWTGNMGDLGSWISGAIGAVNGVTKIWVPLAGGEILGAQVEGMGAGEQEIRVTFKGIEGFAASQAATSNVTVKKGTLSVKVKSASVTVAQGIPADMVTVSDPSVDYVTLYTGATSNIAMSLHLVLPKSLLDDENVLKVIDPIVAAITGGQSFSSMKAEGISLKDLTTLANSEDLLKALQLFGYNTDFLAEALKLVEAVANITPDTRIAFAAPVHAGLYNVTAVTFDDNYNTAIGMGTVLLKQNTSGIKLEWNASMKQLTVTGAQVFDFGAAITSGGARVEEKNVRYRYTGLTKKFRLYSSSKAPTEAGSYIVTAYVIGGDNFAMPITRTFKIVAG